MSGDEQEDGGRQQFTFAQRIISIARGDESRQEIVARMSASLRVQIGEVGNEVQDRTVTSCSIFLSKEKIGIEPPRESRGLILE